MFIELMWVGVWGLLSGEYHHAQRLPLLERTFLNLTQYLATQTTSLSHTSHTHTDIVIIFVYLTRLRCQSEMRAERRPVGASESLAELTDIYNQMNEHRPFTTI